MKEATKTQVTEQLCKQVELMRRGGANQTEIGQLLGVNPCTVSRIEAARFSLEQYIQNRKARRAKEMEKASKAEEPPAEEQEEQIEGQMEMDQIYNMASMILRAVRGE